MVPSFSFSDGLSEEFIKKRAERVDGKSEGRFRKHSADPDGQRGKGIRPRRRRLGRKIKSSASNGYSGGWSGSSGSTRPSTNIRNSGSASGRSTSSRNTQDSGGGSSSAGA